MANNGIMHVELDRLVTNAEVLEASRALWDSYTGVPDDVFPLREKWADHFGDKHGGRDYCLRPWGRIAGTDGTVWISVDAHIYELWSYPMGRGLYTCEAVLGLVERLGRLFPGCRVFVSGDGSLHTETTEVSREEVLDRMRHEREVCRQELEAFEAKRRAESAS